MNKESRKLLHRFLGIDEVTDDLEQILIDLVVKSQKGAVNDFKAPVDIQVSLPLLEKTKVALLKLIDEAVLAELKAIQEINNAGIGEVGIMGHVDSRIKQLEEK